MHAIAPRGAHPDRRGSYARPDGKGLVDAMCLGSVSALLPSDGGGPSLASKLQGMVEAPKAADPTMDDESAAALAGSAWGPWRGLGTCSPCSRLRLKAKRKVGWTVKVMCSAG